MYGVVLAIVCKCLHIFCLFWFCVAGCSASLLLCSFTSQPSEGTKSAAWDIQFSSMKNTYKHWTKLFLHLCCYWVLNIVIVDPFTFVNLKSCVSTTLKQILMKARLLCCQRASQQEPLLISVVLSWSFWGIIEPEPHQLKTRTVPLVLYVNSPPTDHASLKQDLWSLPASP